jgi:hypothetical protein
MPHVVRTEPAREVPVFPGVIDMIVRVVRASVVSNPLAVRMNVRSVGMSLGVAEVAMFCGRLCRGVMNWGRTVCRRVSAAEVPAATAGSALCKYRNGK